MTTQDLVPRRWRDAFVLAMRERDADGRRIGDALAEVEQFCQDSGRGADDAFGPAGEYAATLLAGEPRGRRDRRAGVAAAWLMPATTAAAVLLALATRAALG